MDLWSVKFEIQDNLKNIFSEYVEDFEGYISSSLFVNEDDNNADAAVEPFGDAESCQMAGSIAADAVAGQRQDYAGCFDAIAAHKNSAIVEWCVGGEQIQQQLTTELRTDGDAGVEEVLRPKIAAHVHHDQGSPTLL
mgnify:CR=1 FL=1